MSTFQEFLEKLHQRQKGRERRERLQEWVGAVNRLLAQIRTWLAESDPKKLLDVIPIEVQRVEPGLGVYTVPALRIGVGEASVEVSPIGREALGVLQVQGREPVRAEGRVDITDEARKHTLYRVLSGGKETWYALDDFFMPVELDRRRLEAILEDMLG